ncbi:MAG: hypothetical protein WC367_07520 [Methanoregula sp.]|jgi:hypothetical protein
MILRWSAGFLILAALLIIPAGAANVTPVSETMEDNMTMVCLSDENADLLTVSPVDIVISNMTTDEYGKKTITAIAYTDDNLTGLPRAITVTATTAEGTYNVSVVTVKTGTFLPVNNLTFSTAAARTAFYKQTVNAGANETWVDLSWPDARSALDLMVYAPDAVLGPFNDTADGRADHRIFLDVAGKNNVTPGDWYYRVTNTGNDTSPYLLNTYTS